MTPALKWLSQVDHLAKIYIALVKIVHTTGELMGFQIVPQALYDAGYVNNGLLVLPPAAFVLLGLIVWVQRTWVGKTNPDIFEES